MLIQNLNNRFVYLLILKIVKIIASNYLELNFHINIRDYGEMISKRSFNYNKIHDRHTLIYLFFI
mgnify:CR=1 FL=1